MLQDLRISYCGPGSGALCRRLLEELPDWFGIPETIDSYAETAEAVPAVVASLGGSDIGILTLVRRTTVAAEIQVMAVARAYHRQGVGRAMLARAERELEDEGIEFLQVKTLSDAAGYEPYTRTRAFYEACGFRALEVGVEHVQCRDLSSRDRTGQRQDRRRREPSSAAQIKAARSVLAPTHVYRPSYDLITMNEADPLIGDYGSRNGAKVERRTPTVLRVIVLGYITAVAMPPVGLVIGIVLALHRPTGRSKHWLWIVIVSLVAAVLWFLIIKSGVFNTTNSDLSY